MAIERTGSVVTINIPSGTEYLEGSQSISVPTDADFIVATFAGYRKIADWFNVPMFTLGSDIFTQACATDPMEDSGQTIVIETLALPDTGTQTFYWDYSDSSTVYAGGIIHIVFYKGVDHVKDSRVNSSGNDVIGMSYTTDCMMFGSVMSFTTSVSVTESGQTSIVNPAAYRYTIFACAQKVGTGGFDTSGGADVAAAAIILSPPVFYEVSANLGIGAVFTASLNAGIVDASIQAGAGVSAVFGAINFTRWMAVNKERIVYRYYARITGAADGLEDFDLPGLKSVQLRMRSGQPSYLSLVHVYSDAAAAAIVARQNGDLVVDMAAVVDGVESLREELLRTGFFSMRYDRGAISQSISLVGYRTHTTGGRRIVLSGVTTETLLADGRLQYRCAAPDFYLRPGDTAVYGGTEITVGTVTCLVSPASQFMDVAEA